LFLSLTQNAMKTKNKAPILKTLAYTTLLLCLSVSCKKDPPPELLSGYHPELDCDDGTCCSTLPDVRYEFVAEFKDEPVTFSRDTGAWPGIGFKNKINGESIAGFVCELSYDIIKDWENTGAPAFSGLPSQYKHRVSGKIYYNKNARVFCINCAQPFEIRIEKAEIIP
jgi:hypothetical protein